MSKTKVAIFGCGPSGLFAAWAAIQGGAEVTIISKKRRSELYGAQYLHMPIPEVPAECRQVEYRLLGSVDNYRQRVYGDSYLGPTSVDTLIGYQEAWDIRSTYNFLYDLFEDKIRAVKPGGFDGAGMKRLLDLNNMREFDLIFSTIPLPSICLKPDIHKFESQRVWAVGDAPGRGQKCPIHCDAEKILCNGLDKSAVDGDAPDWYRVSNVFGHTTAEWPAWHYPNLSIPAADVRKPISTNCDCHPEVRMLGRYGKWEKGVLSHQAYIDVEGILL